MNKKSVATFVTAICLAAFVATGCNDNAAKEESTEVGSKPSAINNKGEILAGRLDPVCEMERDSTWTDYHVVENDTVWFCSETCKNVFAGNPSRYIK